MPYYRKLTPAASGRFRERLRAVKASAGLSLEAVARIIQCSRKTAWNLLAPEDDRQVRYHYAYRLADHCGMSAADLCVSAPGTRSGVADILSNWKIASSPARRRKLVHRLGQFIHELAVVSYDLAVAVEIKSGIRGEPASMRVSLSSPGSRATFVITLQFDHTRRGSIPMIYTDHLQRDIYSGELNQIHLGRLLKKSKSWQQLVKG